MFAHRGVVVATVVGAAVLIAFLAARHSPADGTPPAREAEADHQPRPMTAEMPRLPKQEAAGEAELLGDIRQQIGSPLDGFMLGEGAGDCESSGADSFREMIASEAQRDRPLNSADRFASEPAQHLPSRDPTDRFARALRDASRVLDTVAADLEDAEAYGFADRLRLRANALRLEARQVRDGRDEPASIE